MKASRTARRKPTSGWPQGQAALGQDGQEQVVSSRRDEPAPLPAHWSAEMAPAVFDGQHTLREQLRAMFGSAVQQAGCNQLAPQLPLPSFDPNDPF